MKKIEDYVLSIPDFPEPGIIFRDITSVLQDADGLQLAIDSMQDCLKDIDVDVIAGTELSSLFPFDHSPAGKSPVSATRPRTVRRYHPAPAHHIHEIPWFDLLHLLPS